MRTYLGLSQRQLAPWLGVSWRLTAYAETGARGLPDTALAQLSRLAAGLPPAGLALAPDLAAHASTPFVASLRRAGRRRQLLPHPDL